jgi:phosphonate degradation associated HDIG domain protein
MLTLDAIAGLFDRHGHAQYDGEPVTQREHALQTALLAEEDGADDALVTASLLHDLGHLIAGEGATPTLRGVDDAHQYVAVPFLRGLFGADVIEPVRLHVDGKRWLCHARPGYHATLSADSKRSLVLQGGVFDAAGAAAFLARPGAAEAVRLRTWDDLAKRAGHPTPPLEHYLQRAARVVQPLPAAAPTPPAPR